MRVYTAYASITVRRSEPARGRPNVPSEAGRDRGAAADNVVTMGNMGGTGDVEFRYRGNRLGMPEEGPGSVPGVGRRLLGVFLDWVLCLGVASMATGVSPADPQAANSVSGLALLIFALYNIVLLTLIGTTVGKRIVGVGVAATGERPLPWPAAMALRTVLLCLVVPAVIYDRDLRGLHDRAAGTVSRRY
ncbi:RDD domain-containing protein [Nocardiopsis gilva]